MSVRKQRGLRPAAEYGCNGVSLSGGSSCGERWRRRNYVIPFVLELVRKAGIMDLWEFLQSWTFMGIMALLLAVLIGVLLFLRSRRPED